LLFQVLLFFVLLFLSVVFHEQGHKIVAGNQWIGYKFNLPWVISCKAHISRMTINQFLYYSLAGFIFSCPVLVLSFFVLEKVLFTALVVANLASASIDFYSFFHAILVISLHKPDLNEQVEKFNKKFK